MKIFKIIDIFHAKLPKKICLLFVLYILRGVGSNYFVQNCYCDLGENVVILEKEVFLVLSKEAKVWLVLY